MKRGNGEIGGNERGRTGGGTGESNEGNGKEHTSVYRSIRLASEKADISPLYISIGSSC
jgi:hypothetical protein